MSASGAPTVGAGQGQKSKVAATPQQQTTVVHVYLGVLSVFIQLVLAIAVMRRADMLTPGFRRVMMLAALAFVGHHFLPLRFRMRAFAALCVASLLIVMGGSASGHWDGLLAMQRVGPGVLAGAALAGICLLPIRFWGRAALLVLAGVGMGVVRSRYLGDSPLAAIWPVVAAFFMFRAILYLYHVSTTTQRPGLVESFAYFSMFPNITVGLFPVVDFKTFVRSHYDSDALVIYQRGIGWIVRGITQLMVYRVIQQLWVLRSDDVTNGTNLVQFVVANVFLYLKVSGQFHLFVGLLLLFGFNLPETNRRYFLASSFTDYWRRVNVYFKDFILKIFYYPMYFRLKRFGPTPALVVATLWSFFATWALHLYQTWWLKGSFVPAWPDALFWFLLGVLVLVNSLWEVNRTAQSKVASSSHAVRAAFGLALRTAGTFATLSVLWSLWSTPGVRLWLDLWRLADLSTLFWSAVVLLAVMVATILFEVLPARNKASVLKRKPQTLKTIARPFALGCGTLVLLYAMCMQTVQARLNSPRLQPWVDAVNTGDSMMDEYAADNAGYYEQLMKPDAANARLWEAVMGKKMPFVYAGEQATRNVQDLRFYELVPNSDVFAYHAHFKTNRWGMRDRDYDLRKPAGTYRIAIVGASQAMGWAVEQKDVFEWKLEERLNAEQPAGPDVHFEVLNFSTHGRSLMGQALAVEQWVAPFKPDMVLLVSHFVDGSWIRKGLLKALHTKVPIPYTFAKRVLHEARITPRTNTVIGRERLKPYSNELLEWGFATVASNIKEIGAEPVAVFLPVPDELPLSPSKLKIAAQRAQAMTHAGFTTIDFSLLYKDEDPKNLSAAEASHHSNARAHALIADGLYKALLAPGIDLVSQAKQVVAADTASRTLPVSGAAPTKP